MLIYYAKIKYTTPNAKINVVKNEICSINNLATTNAFNAKINDVISKIPNITNLATTTALTAVTKKIPNLSDLVKKLTKLLKLKIKLPLIMILINILQLKISIS